MTTPAFQPRPRQPNWASKGPDIATNQHLLSSFSTHSTFRASQATKEGVLAIIQRVLITFT